MSNAVIVVSLEEGGLEQLALMIDEIRVHIPDQPNVKFYAATGENAKAVLELFKDVM